MAAVLARIERLEQMQREQAADIAERDRRIEELEAKLAATGEEATVGAAAPLPAPEPEPAVDTQAAYYGQFFRGGRGFQLANTRYGDVNFSAWTYGRYLNQQALDETYTDAFGRTTDLDLRHDLQLQKVMLYFKGWIADPKLRYLTYLWTSNTSQGLPAQVVIGGNITYAFDDSLNVGVGIGGLPSTRSTEGNSPNWLRVDNRTLADEFFRASFTTGLFVSGRFSDKLRYQAMLGNNLSQLGVDAAQLGDTLDTFSGALIWTPTGPFFNGFGDFEQSEQLGLQVRRALHPLDGRSPEPARPGRSGERVDQALGRHAAVSAQCIQLRWSRQRGALPDGVDGRGGETEWLGARR